MKWTSPDINKLKDLLKRGFKTVAIAKILNTTKNSIIGKANRLRRATRKKQSHALIKYKPQQPTPITELENPTPLISLKENQCKFPLWENSDEPQLFCGRKHQNESSYCKIHHDKTHIKINQEKNKREYKQMN